MKQWKIKACRVTNEQIAFVAKSLRVPFAVAHILAVRGYDTVEAAEAYLSCDLASLPAPTLLAGMDKCCELLLSAIDKGQKIVVFGDYDADGITATAILTLGLRRLGGKVEYYIPQRESEGYGLNSEAVRDLAARGVEVLLTCDNGISAFTQVELAKELGMTVIITDHHELTFNNNAAGECEYSAPIADAIVNPKQPNCPYPFKCLCGGMIAFKIMQRLYELRGRDWSHDGMEYMSLAGIATICDIMDMVAENRTLLRYLLPRIKETPNLGLQKLLDKTGLRDKEIGVYHVGFVIGPCINASGRLELANIAVDLFLTEDAAQADQLAQSLVDLNNCRKHLSNEGVELVKECIKDEHLADDTVIVAYCRDLNESIAGIVAGRIKELYYRPTFVLAGDKEIVRGSGRSIEGYNMFECLQKCGGILDVFGGHPMAAGLSVERARIGELRQALNESCPLAREEMVATITADLVLPIEKVSMEIAQGLQLLEPCGKGNAQPLFGDKKVKLTRLQLLGSDEKVVRLYFSSRYGKGNVSAIMFRQRDVLEQMICDKYSERAWQELQNGTSSGILLDLIYSINVNNFNGRKYAQIQIEDFRLTNLT